MSLKDRGAGGLSLNIILQLFTLGIIVLVTIVGMDRTEQLLFWHNDGEIEREALKDNLESYHKEVLAIMPSVKKLDDRVTNLEQYNARKDPNYLP